jgi:hypothetical protein
MEEHGGTSTTRRHRREMSYLFPTLWSAHPEVLLSGPEFRATLNGDYKFGVSTSFCQAALNSAIIIYIC